MKAISSLGFRSPCLYPIVFAKVSGATIDRVLGMNNFVYNNNKKIKHDFIFWGAPLCKQSHTCTLKYSAWSSGGAIFLGLNGVCDAPDMDRIEPRNPRFRSYGPRLESDSEEQFLTHFGAKNATLSPKICCRVLGKSL